MKQTGNGRRHSHVTLCALLALIILPLSAPADEPVAVYTEKSDNTIHFYADNHGIIPHWVRITFSTRANLDPSVDLPFAAALPPLSQRIPLLSLSIADERKGYSFQFSYTFVAGDPVSARHDDRHAYLIPYEHATKHPVGQGYHGRSTHKGDQAYAIDFDMDIGTTVVAARDGLVVDIKQDSNIGGPSAAYSKHGNYVTIYHDDGSFAYYVHLMQYGALVSLGDRVRAGDQIAKSGNTGRSSGPHLHFAVVLPTPEGTRQSVPTVFLNHDGQPVTLSEGSYYYSTHPGRPPFKVMIGANITNADYADHRRAVPRTGKIAVRKEAVDNTILLFLQNGFAEAHKVTLDVTLRNLQASNPLPIEIEVNPLSEVFICYLRPPYPQDPASYSYRISHAPLEEIEAEQRLSNAQYADYHKTIPQSGRLDMRTEKVGNSVLLFLQNGSDVAYDVSVKLDLTNMKASKNSPIQLSSKALSEMYI